MNFIDNRINYISTAIQNISVNKLTTAKTLILSTLKTNGTVYVFGNGGSAATASHFKNDLQKLACKYSEKKLNVVCLNDNIPLITAIANDINYNNIFFEQLSYYNLSAYDTVIGISTSGNSDNVINAIEYANFSNALTISLTGGDGGRLMEKTALNINTPIEGAENIEDVHMFICHTIAAAIKEEIKNSRVKT